MLFNINSAVMIRLRKEGRVIMRENHQRLTPFTSYVEPVDDYVKMSLWRVMQEFGPHITMGLNPPFDPVIELLGTREPTDETTLSFKAQDATNTPANQPDNPWATLVCDVVRQIAVEGFEIEKLEINTADKHVTFMLQGSYK